MTILQGVPYQSGMILLRKECFKSDNAVDGILTWACEPELKRPSPTVTMETQGFTNSIVCEADDQFGIWHPGCFCVPSCYTGLDCESTDLQSFQQYHLCCAVR